MNSEKNKHTIRFFVQKITKNMYRKGKEELEKKKLTYPQYYTLVLLSDGVQYTMSELKKELSITGPGVTVTDDQLVKRGLVKRQYSKEDRRVVLANITEKGKDLLKTIESERKRFLQTLLKTLSADEQKVIEKAGELFLRALNEIENK